VIRMMSLGFIPLLLRSGAMAVPVGLQRFQIPVVITVGYQILSYTAALVVISLGGSVIQVVISTVVALWIAALGSILVTWWILEPFRLKFTLTRSRETLRRMLSFSLISGVSGLGSQIFGLVDRLTVGVVLGLDAVAYYTVIISVATKILQLSSALTNALMPAVSSWLASGFIKRVRVYFLRSSLFLLTFNFLIASILFILSPYLLRLWVGEEFTNHVLLSFRILIVIYAIISLNTPAFYIAYGMDNPGINALASTMGGCSTIGLIFILSKTLGLLGAVIANGGYLLTLIITVYIYVRINRMIKQGFTVANNQAVSD
jgi:O-antigen/teichoic acid export membrane protein